MGRDRDRNAAGSSTLRNRNRITQKSRLKVVTGNNFESDPIIPDDDDEKNRLLQQTAGVDAEDANEHHLQAVLSAAAAQRQQAASAKPATKDSKKPESAYIPTPEASGIVDGWQQLYPSTAWKDPASYICSSTDADAAVREGLADGFTYYMDERDKEWLDKNNEEARGEGTSAQGAVSPSSPRISLSRSAKAKGKDPETSQPVVISEDQFELVMGLFEKVTHEKTEFLHHSLETGMTFPEYSEYQDIFAKDLPPTMFSNFIRPKDLPKPKVLLRISQIIYPHWKERRLERNGNRIIPILNFDEADTLNESYICFRRREVKAVRKTRAQQVTTSDKLARLQAEMEFPLIIAGQIINREKEKKAYSQQAQKVWEDRLAFVDLKRKFSSLSEKGDEELLIEKERPVKKSESSRLAGSIKIKTRDESTTPGYRTENQERPKDRYARLQNAIEASLARKKELNQSWEDPDNAYQPKPVSRSQHLFRHYQPFTENEDKDKADAASRRAPIAARTRRGRGGRFIIDRRPCEPRRVNLEHARSSTVDVEAFIRARDAEDGDVEMSSSAKLDKLEEAERLRRQVERWRFDQDDVPPVPPTGADEQDRVLVDEFDVKYVRHSMKLVGESDMGACVTDSMVYSTTPEGRLMATATFQRPGTAGNLSNLRRDAHVRTYQQQPQVQISHVGQASGSSPVTAAAMQAAMKKMPPPQNISQMRISSNGGMRPPSGLAAVGQQQQQPAGMQAPTSTPAPQGSPPQTAVAGTSQQASPPNKGAVTVNGVARPQINVVQPQSDGVQHQQPQVQAQQHQLPPQPTAASPPPGQGQQPMEGVVNGNGVPANSPPRPKSQNQNQVHMIPAPNGYHIAGMNGYAAQAIAAHQAQAQAGMVNGQTYGHHPGTTLTPQQVQNLKSAFAAASPQNQDLQAIAAANGNRPLAPGSYIMPNGATYTIPLGNNGNIPLKLPAQRQMQLAASQGSGQQPQQGMVMTNGTTAGIPARTPSRNNVNVNMQQYQQAQGGLAVPQQHPHQQRSSVSVSPRQAHASPTMQATSPPRPTPTPTPQQAQSNGF